MHLSCPFWLFCDYIHDCVQEPCYRDKRLWDYNLGMKKRNDILKCLEGMQPKPR